ncbi:type II toxin-antitoxin system VapC family toxin [Aquibium oceanicum]|uniref:VapC toxin family PIN domain ribonuclease n=1 Tax=Aquibium oceanicum TaxID=1670800 RepID=A0A1L3SWG7_9HYPH|nr:type II toxin-antitoxin system VapC family toxin [Aquibium oceanicum]APH73720.1 VapC toxin family PIN domain ribonuclease [Aquibium oceanicum]
MRYLLDTNIVSDLFRNPNGSVDRRLREHRQHEIGISLIVKAEILFGLTKNDNQRGRRVFEALLETIDVWPLESPAEEQYATLRTSMERQGVQMGPHDLWIACQGIVLDAVVVTDDSAFSQVPGLKVANWLRDVPAVRE